MTEEERLQNHLDNIKRLQKEYADKSATTLHVNEIKLSGDDDWTTQFNLCSDLFKATFDEDKTEEERNEAWKLFIAERQSLELGQYQRTIP